MKRFFMVLWMTVMIPYVQRWWTGRIRRIRGRKYWRKSLLESWEAEIPAEYGIETLKAQAVLETYIYRLDPTGTYPGRGTDIDCLSMRRWRKMGERTF